MIIGIEGGIGQGKTLVMTYLLIQDHLQNRKPLFTNYKLREVESVNYSLKDLISWSQDQVELRKAAIGMDEAHIFLDSRLSIKKTNRLLSYFMLQTGKSDINLYYTTQDFSQVDIRLRKRTDIAIHVRRKGDKHLLTIMDTHNPRKKPKRALINGPDVYQFYDTKEVVKADIE